MLLEICKLRMLSFLQKAWGPERCGRVGVDSKSTPRHAMGICSNQRPVTATPCVYCTSEEIIILSTEKPRTNALILPARTVNSLPSMRRYLVVHELGSTHLNSKKEKGEKMDQAFYNHRITGIWANSGPLILTKERQGCFMRYYLLEDIIHKPHFSRCMWKETRNIEFLFLAAIQATLPSTTKCHK
jgi:hypothetical protein